MMDAVTPWKTIFNNEIYFGNVSGKRFLISFWRAKHFIKRLQHVQHTWQMSSRSCPVWHLTHHSTRHDQTPIQEWITHTYKPRYDLDWQRPDIFKVTTFWLTNSFGGKASSSRDDLTDVDSWHSRFLFPPSSSTFEPRHFNGDLEPCLVVMNKWMT